MQTAAFRNSSQIPRLAQNLSLALVLLLNVALHPPTALGQQDLEQERGELPDGTIYMMQRPADWNKVVIRDLDYAANPTSARYTTLLQRGFAVAGTMRHRLRMYQYDPAREIANLNRVLDRFEAKFGKPSRVIQMGCSGGGHVTLAVSEDFTDRIDGAIALAAHTPVWIMNTFLDGWFALQALIPPAPGPASPKQLPILGMSNNEPHNSTGHGMGGAIPEQWRAALDAAQQTAQGRARIALAFTIGQWPTWVNNLAPQPSFEDIPALQHSMYHTAYQFAGSPGGEARIMFENAASGQQLSWNNGIDYAQFFENASAPMKAAVRKLYAEAGLDLAADLKRINDQPRIEASPYALDFWKQAGRTERGTPKIPLLRMHEVGDPQVPLSLVQGYDGLVQANGKQNLYRTAFVNAPSHCGFNAAETGAAVDIMMRRLDSGNWDSTDPDNMNKLGNALKLSPAPRFVPIDRYKQVKYNRVWEGK